MIEFRVVRDYGGWNQVTAFTTLADAEKFARPGDVIERWARTSAEVVPEQIEG